MRNFNKGTGSESTKDNSSGRPSSKRQINQQTLSNFIE